jgi:hypothetical protein
MRGDMTYDESVALVTRHVAGLGDHATDRTSDADPSTAA